VSVLAEPDGVTASCGSDSVEIVTVGVGVTAGDLAGGAVEGDSTGAVVVGQLEVCRATGRFDASHPAGEVDCSCAGHWSSSLVQGDLHIGNIQRGLGVR